MSQQKVRKKNKVRRFLVFLLMVIIAVSAYKFIAIYKDKSIPREAGDVKNTPIFSFKPTTHSPASISCDNIESPYAILVCLNDRTILMQKESEEKIYPASLTKIMTSIVAIENLPDLQQKIVLSGSMFKKLHSEDAALAGFEPEEKVRAIDLLYGAMLPSGAECCIGLADEISGSEQEFVGLMNKKAEGLGMKNTHFENTTGLHNENHYTTVKDLSVLLGYALKDGTFRKVFTSSRYTSKPTNKHSSGITFYNTMFKSLKDADITGGKILGGKTGYTDEAGLCLASLAQKGGKEYILITAGAKGDHKSTQYNINDALAVYNSLGKE